MHKVKLDPINQVILKTLQDDGRITNVDLADTAGISAPPCLRRVRALEEVETITDDDGNTVEAAPYILGYHAELNPARLGFKEMFFALVGLDSQSQTVLREFEEKMAEWKEIRECHMIRGGGDFLLKVVARDKEHRDKLTMEITSAPHVATVTTLETIRTSKNRPGVPVEVTRGHE